MKFWTADSFTNQAFKGNPAAICIVEKFPTDELMQKIAAEINLSETSFVMPKSNGHYDIRWFTPLIEVKLCGHATLAAAHILWQNFQTNKLPIYFDSLSGVLMAVWNQEQITLDFPAYNSKPVPIPNGLTDALKIAPVCVSKSQGDCIVELHSFSDVIQLKPNLGKLAEIEYRGIIVTAEGSEKDEYDFISRFFAPRIGISEDPVTGSSHCKLGPYWAKRLGKKDFTAYQASQRGGVLKVRYENNRVYLTGQAVTVLEGNFLNISHPYKAAP